MARKAFCVVLLSLVAILGLVVANAGISGVGKSVAFIQNLSPTNTANLIVKTYAQTGGAPTTVATPTVEAQAATRLVMADVTSIPAADYAMVIESNEQITAVTRTEWPATRAAGFYPAVPPSTDILIPLVLKNFAQQSSFFTIHNTNIDAAVSDVTVSLFGRGSGTALVTLTNVNVGAGTSKTYDLTNATIFPGLPDNSIDLGTTGFVGSVQVTSSTPLAIESTIDLAGSPAITQFSGRPASSSSATLYCPLIRANYYGDTGISIINSNSLDMTATVTFRGDALSPAGSGSTFTQTINIPANSSAIAFQGPTGNSRQPPTNLPSGTGQVPPNVAPNDTGFFGVGIITAGQPFSAVVNDTLFDNGWPVLQQTTYSCTPASEAATSLALPMVNRFLHSTTRLTTGIMIQNTTASEITASLAFKNWDGTSASVTGQDPISIPPFGSGNFWQGLAQGFPTVPSSIADSGWLGSAVLTCTGACVALLNEQGNGGSQTADAANYEARPIP